MNFYISDTHLGHENIIKLCNRPFKTVKEMDETIIKNWNTVVGPQDDVWIVGDFCFDENLAKDILKQLNGIKHLITGNYDRGNLRKMYATVDSYRKIRDENRQVVLCHYPIVEWEGYFRSTVHLFGHIHNNENDAAKIMASLHNCYNVSADCIEFTPRTLTQLAFHKATGIWKKNSSF